METDVFQATMNLSKFIQLNIWEMVDKKLIREASSYAACQAIVQYKDANLRIKLLASMPLPYIDMLVNVFLKFDFELNITKRIQDEHNLALIMEVVFPLIEFIRKKIEILPNILVESVIDYFADEEIANEKGLFSLNENEKIQNDELADRAF